MKLADVLEQMNKSQLQAYYQHWFPQAPMERTRDALVEKLRAAMTDPECICSRFEALRPAEKCFIQALLLLEDCVGTVSEIRRERPARRIADFEMESILRRLKEQGFLQKVSRVRDGRRDECFTIPEEMAEALRAVVDVERRGAGELLSLAAALDRFGVRSVNVQEACTTQAARERINAIGDPTLRAVVWSALEDYGGILTSSVWRRAGGTGRLNKAAWRRELEERFLGTTGCLNLRDFGIDLEEESLCIYQEIVFAYGMKQAREEVQENEIELSVGGDLVVDLSRLLQILLIEPLDVTRDGFLYKRTEEKLTSQFVLTSYSNLFEGRVLEHLVGLADRLKLVSRSEGKMRINPARVRVWEKRSVRGRVKKIFELFLDETSREHYSFHQRYLRRILLDLLGRFPPRTYLGVRGLVKAAVARFLLNLQKFGIERQYKARIEGNFRTETSLVPLQRLTYDLYFWLVHRLALAGVVDVGYRRAHLHSVALSPLGAAVLGVSEPGESEEGGLLVNPDFEVIQLPGGADHAEETFMLSRFAERTASDRVKRYRLTRESIKRAILSGMKLEEILDVLNRSARKDIPANVLYSLQEWAEGVELIHRERAVVLRSRTPEGMDRLVEVLTERKVRVERLTPTVCIVKGTRGERALSQLRERLKENGIYID